VGIGLSAGAEFLAGAAQAYIKVMYANPPVVVGAPVEKGVDWVPALQFVIHDNLTVLIEPSEDTTYSAIFRLRHVDVMNIQRPISIYAVCPEEVALRSEEQANARLLRQHGYGLLVANRAGEVTLRHQAVPLIQLIPDSEYGEEVKGLPRKALRVVAQAFETYQHRPPLGVAELSEIAEGLVLKAGREAASKGWVSSGKVGPGKIAQTLDELSGCGNCKDARAALGGMRAFISRYRTASHHFPKNKKQAYVKYRECRHAFLDGIKQIKGFRTAMKRIGLSGNLP
jgi:hypothetical protein